MASSHSNGRIVITMFENSYCKIPSQYLYSRPSSIFIIAKVSLTNLINLFHPIGCDLKKFHDLWRLMPHLGSNVSKTFSRGSLVNIILDIAVKVNFSIIIGLVPYETFLWLIINSNSTSLISLRGSICRTDWMLDLAHQRISNRYCRK